MGLRVNFAKLTVLGVIAAAVAYGLERVFEPVPGGSLMLPMVFWIGLAEGCVAIIAAAEIAHASWHRSIARQLLSAYPMILVIGLFFVVLATQVDMYPWAGEHGAYLNRTFFIARHLVMIVVLFAVARQFARECMRGRGARRTWGVIYILLFMIHQSMVGFEWVMSLETPWFSTLFGAWFTVGAFLSGICAGALVLYSRRQRFDSALRYTQKSIGGLMFGFSTFWAYFYFSQLIVIWYGNLPEETSYLAERIGYNTPYWFLARLVFALCWVIPFSVLLGRKPKRTPVATLAMALTIYAGLILQSWLMIHVSVGVHPIPAAIDFAMMAFLFLGIMRSADGFLPREATVLPAVSDEDTARVHP